MQTIETTELNQIPYLASDVLGDRTLFLMPFWDGTNWHHWFPIEGGKLIKAAIADTVQSHYVAKEAAFETDLWVPFIDFLWQRASWREIFPLILALCEDFHNLATCTAKIRHFFWTLNAISSPSLATSFVETELEYIIILARTIFDILQETMAITWNDRIELLDSKAEAQRKKHKMPATFSKMVFLNKTRLKTADEIVAMYALPQSLVEVYLRHATFFSSLRMARDRVIHSGSAISTIFVTEKGFCIDPRNPIFAEFDIWNESHKYNENLSSILPLIANIIFHTMMACNDLLSAFSHQIQFPPEIAPEYKIFIRNPNNDALLDLFKVYKGEKAWWDKTIN